MSPTVKEKQGRKSKRPLFEFRTPIRKNRYSSAYFPASTRAFPCTNFPMTTGHALVEALLYGKLEPLSPETIFLYSRTGLIHLFSASGFHMSAALMLAAAFSRMTRPLLPAPARKYVLALASFALMLFFGAKTEWSSPLVRAFGFTTLVLLARLFETRPSPLRVFFLSLLAAWVFGRGSALSFLLSALGMAGILYAGGRNFLLLAVAPWAFTAPLVIWCFSLFSPLAPLWNLTFGLAISFTVLPLAILDMIFSSLGIPWRGLGDLASRLMLFFHEALLEIEWDLSLWVDPLPFLALAAVLYALTYLPRFRLTATVAVSVASLLLPRPSLALLDVGQGDGIYLRLPNSEDLLIDAGPPGFKGSNARVNASLENIGVGEIDHLLLTHPDRDHLGGFPSLLARHRAQYLWIREEHLSDPRMIPLLAAAERSHTKIRFLTRHEAPPGLLCWLPPGEGNESSPFCHAKIKNQQSIWLTGDGGFPSENWLLRQTIPKGDFLKVGHHGSAHSTSEEFLAATEAKTALFSAGEKNRYGHPAKSVLDRVREAGLEIRRTDQEGTIRIY